MIVEPDAKIDDRARVAEEWIGNEFCRDDFRKRFFTCARNRLADVLIEYEDTDGLTATVIIEIKNTVWDRALPHRVRPNLAGAMLPDITV